MLFAAELGLGETHQKLDVIKEEFTAAWIQKKVAAKQTSIKSYFCKQEKQ